MSQLSNIATGASLQASLLKGRQGTLTKGDANSEIFKGILSGVQSKEKGLQRGVSSALQGMEAGSRASSILDRKKDLQKYEKVMGYFSSINQNMVEKNVQFEKLNQAKSALLPQISAYSQSITDMDSQTKELSVRQMIDEWNRQSGENVQFISLDGNNPYLATVIQDGQSQVIDMRSLFAGDALAQQDFAMTLPQMQLREQQRRQEIEAQLQNQKDVAARGWANLHQRADFKVPENVFKESSAKTAGLVQQKELPKLETTLIKTTKGLRNIERIEKILQGNEDIFQSQLANIWAGEEPSMVGNALKKLGRKISPEKSKAITQLNKYLQEMVIDKASLFQPPNMFIERVASRSIPNWMMTPEAFKDVLQGIKEDLTLSQEETQNKVTEIRGNIPGRGQSANNSAGMIKAISPQGTPIQIPHDEALIAQLIESGGQLAP